MTTILASKSPRRAKILSDIGWTFKVEPTESEEVSIPYAPKRTVLANAALKLNACRKNNPDAEIIAADTIVWFNGRIYGKPKDIDEARAFLRQLSGKTHSVFTGVAYCASGGGSLETCVTESLVKFKDLSDEIIERYVASVNPVDRAGAYDIDECGDLIVESYTGSYENIMGLPTEPLILMANKKA
ncbi:MAG: septum formation protein Maf [Kiritimatiellae bacterium]|nr:septum formation protein Maf [Kiritimatiellia bacterium]